MLKKTITFKDLDGNDVTEDFYFNLNKAEIAEMELSKEGGLTAYLQEIVQATNGGEIIAAFKDILTKAVGRRSEDGRRFIKSQEITDEFMQSEAYSVFFMELVTDAEASSDFIKAIMPSDLQEKVAQDLELPDPVQSNIAQDDQIKQELMALPAWKRENREPTKAELESMSPEELREAWRAKNKE